MTRIVSITVALALSLLMFAFINRGPSESELRLANRVFDGVPMTILTAERSIPFLGPPPQACEYVLVALSSDAPDLPPEQGGTWQPGPSEWYRPDSHSDNDDLFLCGLNRFSNAFTEKLTTLANRPSTWWRDTGRGGWLYSKEQGLGFYFYLID